MTKQDLTEEITQAIKVSKREAEDILNMILDGMVRALRKGDRIEVRGFGTFGTHMRAARKGRNPRTGVPVEVPQKRVPHFKPSEALKELVNKHQAHELEE